MIFTDFTAPLKHGYLFMELCYHATHTHITRGSVENKREGDETFAGNRGVCICARELVMAEFVTGICAETRSSYVAPARYPD